MKGTIALKYLETQTPVDLVSKIVAQNDKTFGYCFFDEDGLNPVGTPGHPDAKGLVESQAQAKQQTLYIFGAEAPKLDEDLQPWELLRNSKNEIVCVGFFEGDFTGLAKTDSAHIPAYHCMEKLSKKLKGILRATKDNSLELYEYCKSDEFKDEVLEYFTGEGSIVLHFNNNHILWFCNPPERRTINEFGMFSSLCGWETPIEKLPVKEEKPVQAKKGNDKLAAIMAAKGAGAAKPTPVGSGTILPDKRTSEAPKPAAVPSNGPTTYEGILMTKTLRILPENKAENLLKQGGRFRHLKNWFFSVGDNSWPAGFDEKQMQEIWSDIVEAYKSGKDWVTMLKKLPGVLSKTDKEDAKKQYDILIKTGLATDVGTSNRVTTGGKDDVVKVITPTEGDTESFLPTMSERSVAELKKFTDTYWDRNHQPLERDPTKLKAYEEKYPTFLEKAGLSSWSQMFGLPLEAYQMICKRHDTAKLFMLGAITEIERLSKLVPQSQQQPSQGVTAASLPGARKRA